MDVIRKRHGTWNAALMNAGLATGDDPRMPHVGRARPQYTVDEKLAWVRRTWTELGEPFSSAAYKSWRSKKVAGGETEIPALPIIDHPRNYKAHEAVASVRRCAEALGHIPSSTEYHGWVINRRACARDAGKSTRPFVHYKSVLNLLAPDRSAGNGWRLVRRRIFDRETRNPCQHSG